MHQIKKDDILLQKKKHLITAILLTFKINTSLKIWSFVIILKVKIYHLKTIRIVSILDTFSGTVWHEKRCANLFFEAVILHSTIWSIFGNCSTDDRDHFLFVNSLINYFAPWPFLDAKLLIKTIFFAKHRCLLLFTRQSCQWDNDINIAGSLEALFVVLSEKMILLQTSISSFKAHIFTPNFVYPFHINRKMWQF